MPPETLIRPGDRVRLSYRIRTDAGLPLKTAGLDDRPHECELVLGSDSSPLPGLDAAIIGTRPNQDLEVVIPAAQAFGERRPELVFEAVRENLPDDVELAVGMPLYTTSERSEGRAWQLRVQALTEKGALLDGNHPLAGCELPVRVYVSELS
ncbi:peptidylprolyl isomerase [Thioalkalivibrio sp. ARh3]|uniref:FKBP-type peptidyl-prolyl cis-trans isomerase n=1 Tax=Thioalkalivibrio sp. ARh3 TaxID=1158148 RepID=UPI00036DDE87|nr:FKBP-type peptidyl-prolyl cis-trans isomerase [Thioalkalivibrio sp. ARh3]